LAPLAHRCSHRTIAALLAEDLGNQRQSSTLRYLFQRERWRRRQLRRSSVAVAVAVAKR
jgi:hypothetical protein